MPPSPDNAAVPPSHLPIAIIGAGPAGSLAAILLARAGQGVVLFDQHAFPRDKVCGECISALGADILQRHDLLQALQAAGAVALRRMVLHSPLGSSTSLELPRPMWGLSRWRMDHLLLEAARAAGAQVRLRCRCESIQEGQIQIRELGQNQIQAMRVSLVLLADGKSAFLTPRPADTTDLGIKAHFECVNLSPDTIALFGARSCYGGIAPVEAGRFNLAFAVPKSRVRPDLDRLLSEIASENPALAHGLRTARRLGDFLASPLPRFAVRQRWPAGLIPLGNAAAALEPIGGEGMGLAFRSAEIAVGEILAANAQNRRVDARSIQHAYRALWPMRRAICRLGALVVSRPLLCETSAQCLAASDALAGLVLGLVGKGAAAG